MLDKAHRKELRESAISDETIEAAGIYSEYLVPKLHEILGWKPRFSFIPALVFPFRNIHGVSTGFSRIKPSRPRKNKEGKPVKYEQPRGEHSRAYFTPAFFDAINSGSLSRVYITEGEKKALSMSDHIGPTIGLTGVWNWTSKRVECKDRELIPDLANVPWDELEVIVVFDADDEHKPSVELAQVELCRVLERHGATVEVRYLDPLQEVGKGIDDLIAADRLQAVRAIVCDDEWRIPSDLTEAKQRSLASPGIYFTDAPSGAGKSLSDRELIQGADSSLTCLPTLQETEEREATYQSWGVDAKAFPPHTKKNCENPRAFLAKKVGFSPSIVVCPRCELRDSCEYRREHDLASAASHQLVTHKRLEVIAGGDAEGKQVVTIHERAIDCLRPTRKLIADKKRLFLRAADIVIEAMDLAYHTYDGQPNSRKFFAWFQMAKRHVRWARQWLLGEEEQIEKPVGVVEPRGAQERIFEKIESSLRKRGVDSEGETGPDAPVDDDGDDDDGAVDPSKARRDNAYLMNAISDFIHIGCLGASGRIDSVFPLDSPRRLITEREVPLDSKNQVVWVQDATTSAKSLQRILGGGLIRSCSGEEPKQLHPIYQLVLDYGRPRVVGLKGTKSRRGGITKRTDPKIVAASILRLVRSLPEHRTPVGVICHPEHERALRESLGGLSSIFRIEHFHGKSTRGVNDWHHECNLMIVCGTPRVPPTEIFERAAQLRGRKISATEDHQTRYWAGRDRHGNLVPVAWLGYVHRDIDAAYRETVVAELKQCVGRARIYSPEGCPVVVFANEPLGLWDFETGPYGKTQATVMPGANWLIRFPQLFEMHGCEFRPKALSAHISLRNAKCLIKEVNDATKSDPACRIGWLADGRIDLPWLHPVTK